MGIENLLHRANTSLRGCQRLGGQFWYWRLGYALWLESLSGAAHLSLDEPNLVYGETPLMTAHQLLAWAQIQPGQRFCEIGCGRAVVALVAELVFGAQAQGFEIVPRRADKARWLSRALQAQLSIAGEFQATPADLYYLTPTTWSSSHWQEVLTRLNAAAPAGAQALSLTVPIPDWDLVGQQVLPYSWGWSQTYLMRKPAAQH